VSTIGIDLVAFSTLQFLQAGGLNYTPLFALPVLTARCSVRPAGLGTAAGVTLLLLADAWVALAAAAGDRAAAWCRRPHRHRLFVVALLANQLAAAGARGCWRAQPPPRACRRRSTNW
jgi:two-component system sensor histidine kinase PilS (NtrC family)